MKQLHVRIIIVITILVVLLFCMFQGLTVEDNRLFSFATPIGIAPENSEGSPRGSEPSALVAPRTASLVSQQMLALRPHGLRASSRLLELTF